MFRRTPMSALPLAACLLLVPAMPATASTRAATVVRVVDGDTVRVRAGAAATTLELAGVSAPEGSACFARQATSRLRSLLPAGVRIRFERRPGTRSAWIRRGTRAVNVAVVASGHARAGSLGGARGAAIRAAQTDARDAGAGLWTACAAAPAPPAPAPAPTPTPTPEPEPIRGEEAKTILRSLLRHQHFKRIGQVNSSSGSLSSRDEWGFCNEAYASYSFSSGSFGSSEDTDTGTWSVIDAVADPSRRAAQGTIQLTSSSRAPRTIEVGIDSAGDDLIDELRFSEQQAYDCSGAPGD